MSEQQQEIIEFTVDDFLLTTKPYDYLWNLRDNPFRMRQEAARLERAAKALGISSKFSSLWKGYQITMAPDRSTLILSNVTEFPGQEIALKCENYICDVHGVRLDDPRFGEVRICCHPIMPTRRIVNLDTKESKTEIAWLRGKGWRKQIFDASILGSAQKIIAMKSVGIAVNSENAKQMVAYLGLLEDANWDTLTEQMSIGRLGWMESGFSPYADDIIFDGQEQFRHAFEAVRIKGSFDKWLECIRKMRKGDGTAARIMMAASFSSVLIRKFNALPFIVHCWSNTSGTGKTVSLMAAASVWAYPQRGEFVKTYNATSVGIEMSAGFYSDLPLCMDELQLRGGRRENLDATIYQFCEGVGRTRGSKTGGLQKTMSWKNCMISTGEEPLVSGNSRAGAVNRVLEMNSGEVKLFDDLIEAASIVTNHYGHAGKAFVESLTEENLDAIKAVQEDFYKQLDGKTTDKQRLSASIILAADWWATKTIFKDNRALTIDELVPCLQSEKDVDVNLRAYDWLTDAISANAARFDKNFDGERWGKIDEAASEAYIIKSIFDRIMQAEGYNSVGFLAWAKHEHLIRWDGGEQKHLSVKTRVPGMAGTVRCICIKIPGELDDLVDPTTGYVMVDEQQDLFTSA